MGPEVLGWIVDIWIEGLRISEKRAAMGCLLMMGVDR